MRLRLEEPFPGPLPARDIGAKHRQGGPGVTRFPDASATVGPTMPPIPAAPALRGRGLPAPRGTRPDPRRGGPRALGGGPA
eukprot:11081354-Lingulodinium_polyedra.AAC.1